MTEPRKCPHEQFSFTTGESDSRCAHCGKASIRIIADLCADVSEAEAGKRILRKQRKFVFDQLRETRRELAAANERAERAEAAIRLLKASSYWNQMALDPNTALFDRLVSALDAGGEGNG